MSNAKSAVHLILPRKTRPLHLLRSLVSSYSQVSTTWENHNYGMSKSSFSVQSYFYSQSFFSYVSPPRSPLSRIISKSCILSAFALAIVIHSRLRRRSLQNLSIRVLSDEMQAKSADKVRSGEQVPGAEHISKKRKKSQDGADTTKRVAVEEASSGVKKSKKDKSERKAKKEKRRKRHGEESQPTLEPETEAMTIDDVRTGTTLGKEDEDAEIVRERRTKVCLFSSLALCVLPLNPCTLYANLAALYSTSPIPKPVYITSNHLITF